MTLPRLADRAKVEAEVRASMRRTISMAGLPIPRGRRAPHVPGQMNKTEARYAEYLTRLVLVGQVAHFWFEPFQIVLAPKTTYRPDFLVMASDGTLRFDEVKGLLEDDAAVKLKVAASALWAFPFWLVREKPINVWHRQEIAK